MIDTLLIGSRAYSPSSFKVDDADYDFIATINGAERLIKSLKEKGEIKHQYPISSKNIVIQTLSYNHIEIELAYSDSSAFDILGYANKDSYCLETLGEREIGQYALANVPICWLLKESHKFKDSVHFEKTMRDVLLFREKRSNLQFIDYHRENKELLSILSKRETETYRKPISLNKTKDEFFANDNVPYIYDHDEIHKVMSVGSKPAYLSCLKEGSQVKCDRFKFFYLSEESKMNCVVEEARVIALERAIIPFDKVGKVHDIEAFELFKKALIKICTTLCSGWFREYAWSNYYKIIDYHTKIELKSKGNYAQRFAMSNIKPLNT